MTTGNKNSSFQINDKTSSIKQQLQLQQHTQNIEREQSKCHGLVINGNDLIELNLLNSNGNFQLNNFNKTNNINNNSLVTMNSNAFNFISILNDNVNLKAIVSNDLDKLNASCNNVSLLNFLFEILILLFFDLTKKLTNAYFRSYLKPNKRHIITNCITSQLKELVNIIERSK